MSSAIPPLIPTVPPPMGSDEENNVDDEFGDFTDASYSYDCLGDSSGTSPAKRSTWIERVDQGIFTNKVSPLKKKADQAVGVYDDEVYHNCSETIEKEEDTKELTHETAEKCENIYRISHIIDGDAEDDESDLGNCEKSIVENVEEKKIDFLSVDRGIPGNAVAQDNTSQDSVISSGATDSGLCSASQKSEEEEVAYCGEVGINVDAALDDSSGSDETLVVEKKKVQQERSNEWNDARERTTQENLIDTNSSLCAKEACVFENDEWRTRLSDEEYDDFADFSAFRASDRSSESNEVSTSPGFDINHSSVTDKEYNERYFEDEGGEQDDFSDFASATLPSDEVKSFVTFQSKCDVQHVIQAVNSDGEFSDFAFASNNSKTTESATESVSEVLEDQQQKLEHQKSSEDGASEQVKYLEDLEVFQQLESGKVNSKIEAIANLAFPSSPSLDEGEEVSNREDLKMNLRAGIVWKKLQDLESTHALSYQWGGSSSNRVLLSALSIDSRNILFGPRWNSTSVPRFAANLGFDPLEPVKASSTVTASTPKVHPGHEDAGNLHRAMQPPRANAAQTSEENVPAAQFDWNSSGLVNPLESTHRSALLDLDFFTTYDNFASSSSSSSSTAPSDAAWRLASLEKEFLSSPEKKMDPSSSINPFQPPSSQKHLQDSHQQLVERILSSENSQKPGQKNKNSLTSRTKTNRKRVEGLTLCPESLAMIHNLPDLSFINARMLMFPLREPTNGEAGPQSCPVALVSMTSSSSPCPE